MLASYLLVVLVPSQVLHLETLNASSKSIAVEWSKPQNPNGVITQYRILVRKVIERGDEVLKQQIWLNCERCQTPCSSAGSNVCCLCFHL